MLLHFKWLIFYNCTQSELHNTTPIFILFYFLSSSFLEPMETELEVWNIFFCLKHTLLYVCALCVSSLNACNDCLICRSVIASNAACLIWTITKKQILEIDITLPISTTKQNLHLKPKQRPNNKKIQKMNDINPSCV